MLRGFQSYLSSKVGTGSARSSWAATLTFVAALCFAALPLNAAAQTNIGSVALGSSIASTSVPVTIPTAGTVSSVAVLTEGAPSLDFTLVSAGTCTGSVTTSCTATVKFAPKAAGARNGAVVVYSSTAVLGTAYITGTGTGPQLVFPYPLPTPITITGGPTSINNKGVAVDGAGNIYSVGSDGYVYKSTRTVDAATGLITYPSTQIFSSNLPVAVAVDGAGNVFVTDTGQAVYRLTLLPTGSYAASTNILAAWVCVGGATTGCFTQPGGVAVDAADNLYVTDTYNEVVYKLTITNGAYSAPVAITAPSGGWKHPTGVAVDAAGNVYVVDVNSANVYISVVYEAAYSGGSYSAPVAIAGGGTGFSLSNPNGVAVDGNGDVYIAEWYGDQVDILTPSGSGYSEQQIGINSTNVFGVAADGAGNVYYIGSNNGAGVVGVYPLVTPAPISFGSKSVGETSSSKLVNVLNIGNAALNISAVTYDAPNFTDLAGVDTLTNECLAGGTVAAGSNCILPIEFTPVAASLSSTQPITGAVTLTSNAIPATQTVDVSGTATQGMSAILLASSVNPAVLGSSVTFTASVIGPGGVNSTGDISTIPLSGTVTFGLAGSPIASCTAVTLTNGVATCTLSNLALGANAITATYSGNTVYAAPSSPTSLAENVVAAPDGTASSAVTSVGTVTVGASTPGTAVVTVNFATLSSPVTLGNIAVLTQGVSGKDFTLAATQASTGACATGTAYGSTTKSCTVTVAFNPLFTGPRYGAVVLSDNGSPANIIATAYISGIGSGSQIAFLPGEKLTVGQFSDPFGVAVDGGGNVYVADQSATSLYRETLQPDGSYLQDTIGSGMKNPINVAVDGAGNLYVVDATSVYLETRQPSGSYVQSTLGSNWHSISGVAVDAQGNVYVSDQYLGVFKLTLSGGSYIQTQLDNSFQGAEGIAVDSGGNVYVADYGSYSGSNIVQTAGNVYKETLTSGGSYTRSVIGSGWVSPISVAVDGNGNLYVGDYNNDTGNGNYGRIVKETLQADGSYVQSLLVGNISYPGEMALNGAGNVYVAAPGNGGGFVYEFNYSNPAPSTQPLSFAETPLGVASSDSPRTITVENIGNVVMNVTTIGIPADFPAVSPAPAGACATSSTTIAANGSCTLTIDFLPTKVGALAETISVTGNAPSNDGGSADDFNLAGTADAGITQVTSLTSSLNPTWVGNSVTFTATVSSGLGQAVPTGTVEFSNQGIDLTGCSAVALNSSGVATCTASFTAAGTYYAVATYSGNSAAAWIAEYVTASAPATGNFGDTSLPTTNIGTSSASTPVTITFNSAATLGGIKVLTQGVAQTANGPNLDFTSTQICTQASMNSVPQVQSSAKPLGSGSMGACACGTSYTAGESCTVGVVFTPKYAGPRSGAVVLTTGTGGNILGTGYLLGTGVGAQTVFAVPVHISDGGSGYDTYLEPGYQSSIGSGWSKPFGVAVDGANNVYIADGSSAVVIKKSYSKNASGVVTYTSSYIPAPQMHSGNAKPVHAAASNGVPAADLWADPVGVAVDGAGNVYVADAGYGSVFVSAQQANGSYAVPAVIDTNSEYCMPTGVAVDGNGNVYVADFGGCDSNGGVYKETLLGDGIYTQSTVDASNFESAAGVAVDGSGNVYVTDAERGNVVKETLQTNGSYAVSYIGDSWEYPVGIAVDGNGNVYVADPEDSEVAMEQPVAGEYFWVSLGDFYAPYELALDPRGNLYVADDGSNGGSLNGGGDAVRSSRPHANATHRSAKGAISPAAILNGGEATAGYSSTPSVYFLDFADPPQLGFATTAYDATSQDSPQVVAVNNFGNAPLTFSSLSYPKDFPAVQYPSSESSETYTSCTASTQLASGGYCLLTMAFSPATLSTTSLSTLLQENVVLKTNALNVTDTQSVAVSGTETQTKLQLPAPNFSLTPGTYQGPQTVYLSDTNTGAGTSIYYAFGSTTPNPGTTGTYLYTSAGISVTTSETINAIAVANGYYSSVVSIGGYGITGTPDFTITVNGDTTATVQPGTPAVFNFLLTPIIVGGSGGGDAAAPLDSAQAITFASNVVLSCTSVPALPGGCEASFLSPNPLTAGTTAHMVTLTIPTSRTTTASKQGGSLVSRVAPFSLALLLLPFAGLLRKSGKRFSRMVSLLILLTAGAVAVAGVSGCNNAGFFGQASQTYTVTVTGTMGSLSHNATVTLTVE